MGVLLLLPVEAAPALNSWPHSMASSALPMDFGEIVYRRNADSPLQLYIVANSHRSALSGANGSQTVQAQLETFKIGEWLIRQQQVDLILPEGFFGSRDVADLAPAPLFDQKILRDRLSDTSVFVNAEQLLHEYYGVPLQQVEDRELYLQAKDFLSAGLESGALYLPSFSNQLEYLQKRRSAAILQRVPRILGAELREGRVAAPRAMLTIGLSHMDEIITFLERGEVRIAAPSNIDSADPVFSLELELLKKNVGVTVIIPRTLMTHRADFAKQKA
ncbi:MAG: hypothetical protein JXK94_15090 [Deltaproteobacteria bacterium]|nr:hypothetical protein [Deltaproteobacteria bacterium]